MELTSLYMFLGFLFAAYSIIANDSIQTLGTFIASNRNTRWQYLWLFASAILVSVIVYSYVTNSGDISSGRLEKIPFVEIKWFHILAPLVLIVLTHISVPISTSLLILSIFASSLVLEQIFVKSAAGYGVAAIGAYFFWMLIHRWDNKKNPLPKEHERRWRIFQWCTTGFLWFIWLSHDIANIAVFLPRDLSVPMLLFVLTVFILGLGYIFKHKGGNIQNIVLEKSHTNYIRSATLIDLCYGIVLLVFKEWSSIPMSTTWVFIGLLSGREFAISTMMGKEYQFKHIFPIVGKDTLRLLFGLGVSIALALLIQNFNTVAGFFE